MSNQEYDDQLKQRGGRIDPITAPDDVADPDARVDEAIAESFPASDPPSSNAGVEPQHENPGTEELRAILQEARTIAVVGASSNPERASNGIMKRLQSVGYRVIPVNPRESEVLGEKAYASLREVPVDVDIVDVFRRADETPAIADDSVAIDAKTLWLQSGISSQEAARRATAGGLVVVMDRCLGHTLLELGISRVRQEG